MTIREATSEFENLLTYHHMSDDSRIISPRLIYRLIVQARAKYYREQMERGRQFSQAAIQSIPCIELKEADRSTCPSTPPSGCIWLESVLDAPIPIQTISVSNDIGNKSFDYIPWDRVKSISTGRIRSSRKGSYYTTRRSKNGGLKYYILNNIFLKNITVDMVAEEPLDALAFCEPNAVECYPLDQDIFTDQASFNTIIKMAVDDYVRLLPVQEKDILNNDRPDQ